MKFRSRDNHADIDRVGNVFLTSCCGTNMTIVLIGVVEPWRFCVELIEIMRWASPGEDPLVAYTVLWKTNGKITDDL